MNCLEAGKWSSTDLARYINIVQMLYEVWMSYLVCLIQQSSKMINWMFTGVLSCHFSHSLLTTDQEPLHLLTLVCQLTHQHSRLMSWATGLQHDREVTAPVRTKSGLRTEYRLDRTVSGKMLMYQQVKSKTTTVLNLSLYLLLGLYFWLGKSDTTAF